MAAAAAQAALNHVPQVSLETQKGLAPVRQDGRTPLRNCYSIELALIEADPDQPRRHFDDDALEELAASIKARGVKQPLTVRWDANAKAYRLIDGERRYRAAKKAQLTELPCVLAEGNSQIVLIDQIVHNWQRADLRPYETADALVRLKHDFSMPLQEIAAMTGKSLGEVSKLIALVEKVAPEVQQRVRHAGTASLTKRHLYMLSQLDLPNQKRWASRIEREQLTAVETERLIRAGLEPSAAPTSRRRGRPAKNIRLTTKHGRVVLSPTSPNCTHEVLLAMLNEARDQIVNS